MNIEVVPVTVDKLKEKLEDAGRCDKLNERDKLRAQRLEIFKNDFPFLVGDLQKLFQKRTEQRKANKERMFYLLDGLCALHPRQAEVIDRHYVQGQTMELLAEEMAYSLEHLYRLQRQGLELLAAAAGSGA